MAKSVVINNSKYVGLDRRSIRQSTLILLITLFTTLSLGFVVFLHLKTHKCVFEHTVASMGVKYQGIDNEDGLYCYQRVSDCSVVKSAYSNPIELVNNPQPGDVITHLIPAGNRILPAQNETFKKIDVHYSTPAPLYIKNVELRI